MSPLTRILFLVNAKQAYRRKLQKNCHRLEDTVFCQVLSVMIFKTDYRFQTQIIQEGRLLRNSHTDVIM